MALQLSWTSWPREIAEHAKAAFTNLTFVITFVVITTFYVTLWLTPDPSMMTKAAALAFTAVLLYNFAKEDVIGFLQALRQLFTDCAKASSVAELEAAGGRFAKMVGQVGFDIILFLVTWRIAKRVEPKLREYGAKRSVERVRHELDEARRLPGADDRIPARGNANEAFEAAQKSAKDGSPTEILNALAERLDADARRGLEEFRGKGDENVLRALTERQRRGEDVPHSLRHRVIEPSVRKQAQESLRAANDKVARAEAIANKLDLAARNVLDEPRVRAAVKNEKMAGLLMRLERIGVLKQAVERLQRRLGLEGRGKMDRKLDRGISALGEAISYVELQAKYPPRKGYKVIGNVEVVERVPGYRSIAEWKAANAKLSDGQRRTAVARMREGDGQLWTSKAEVDNMVIRPGRGGKVEIVELEQVKTGSGDSHAKAAAQNEKAMSYLLDRAHGNQDMAVFIRELGSKLGRNLTRWLDLGKLSQKTAAERGAMQVTRGPADKTGFDRSLGLTVKSLVQLTHALIELQIFPDAGLTRGMPLVSPGPEESEE